ncbi:MAG: hypothetical protein J6T10_24805 [Methanobrevibacter sp.]|nr:hypothetical protein [Methanobrevibacter sp.]
MEIYEIFLIIFLIITTFIISIIIMLIFDSIEENNKKRIEYNRKCREFELEKMIEEAEEEREIFKNLKEIFDKYGFWNI